MKLTEEEASDLDSLHKRVIDTALAMQNAKFDHDMANRKYEELLWKFVAMLLMTSCYCSREGDVRVEE